MCVCVNRKTDCVASFHVRAPTRALDYHPWQFCWCLLFSRMSSVLVFWRRVGGVYRMSIWNSLGECERVLWFSSVSLFSLWWGLRGSNVLCSDAFFHDLFLSRSTFPLLRRARMWNYLIWCTWLRVGVVNRFFAHTDHRVQYSSWRDFQLVFSPFPNVLFAVIVCVYHFTVCNSRFLNFYFGAESVEIVSYCVSRADKAILLCQWSAVILLRNLLKLFSESSRVSGSIEVF